MNSVNPNSSRSGLARTGGPVPKAESFKLTEAIIDKLKDMGLKSSKPLIVGQSTTLPELLAGDSFLGSSSSKKGENSKKNNFLARLLQGGGKALAGILGITNPLAGLLVGAGSGFLSGLVGGGNPISGLIQGAGNFLGGLFGGGNPVAKLFGF